LHFTTKSQGYTIYDFFLPGPTIHTIESRSFIFMLGKEIIAKGYQTVNMFLVVVMELVLDLKEVNGQYKSMDC
jgi:sucrose phosphorylase